MKIGTKIIEAASSLVGNIGDAFDKNFTNSEEKLEAKTKLLNEANSLTSLLIESQKEILTTEMQGNWLQRSWRPITMLCFTLVVIYAYFLQPAFFPNAVNVYKVLPSDFWELLSIGMGGYVIGRSAETISKNVAEAIKKK